MLVSRRRMVPRGASLNIKSLGGNAGRKAVPPIHGPADVTHFTADKAVTFPFQFEMTFLENADSDDLDDSLEIDAGELVDEMSWLQDRPVDPVSVAEISVLSFKIGKKRVQSSTGPSNVVKFCHCSACHIGELHIRACYCPFIWKNVNVLMIPKPGKDHCLPQSCRPISLISDVARSSNT